MSSNAPSGMMHVEEFSRIQGVPVGKVIGMVRDGYYVGRSVEGQWYVARSELNSGSRGNSLNPPASGVNAGMFALRFIVLLFLVAYSFSMGQIPASDLNAFGKFASALFFVVAPAFYFLPTIEAWLGNHKNIAAISVINAFLGWSLIGWVGALVWAFKKPEAAVPMQPSVSPTLSRPSVPVMQAQTKETKACPYCAEDILAAAIKCKHCGSTL